MSDSLFSLSPRALWAKLRGKLTGVSSESAPPLSTYSIAAYHYSRGLLDTLTRLHFDLPLPTNDDSVDSALRAAIDLVVSANQPHKSHSRDTVKFYEWIQRNEETTSVLGLHRVLSEEIHSVQESAKAHTNGESTTTTQVEQIRDKFSNLRRQYSANLRLLQQSKVDRLTLGEWLGHPSAVPWLAFVSSALVTVSGYIYAVTYFGHFDIDTSMFLSVGDYLSHSITKLWVPLVAFLACFGFAVFARAYYQSVPNSVRTADVKWFRRMDRWTLLLFVLLTVLLIWRSPVYFFANPLLGWLLALLISGGVRYIARKTLRISRFAEFACAVLVFCLCLIWLLAKTQAHNIIVSEPEVFLVEADGVKYDQRKYRMIGLVSEYVFLMDGEGELAVLPRHTVERIVVAGNDSSWAIRARRQLLDRLPQSLHPEAARTE